MAKKKSQKNELEIGTCLGIGVFAFSGFLTNIIFELPLLNSLLISFFLSLILVLIVSREL
jgi:hypothetical protein